MPFIEELTPIHQAALGGALVLIACLLFVAARRRRAAASAPEGVKATRSARRSARKAANATAVPRRKRRKLAAEAAATMGDMAIPAVPVVPVDVPVPADGSIGQTIANDPTPTTPEVVTEAIVEVNEPAEEVVSAEIETGVIEIPVPASAAVILDDPYVQAVSQPGWPAPGELASSFDPDAFDPVPEHGTAFVDDSVELYGEVYDAPSLIEADPNSSDVSDWEHQMDGTWDEIDELDDPVAPVAVEVEPATDDEPTFTIEADDYETYETPEVVIDEGDGEEPVGFSADDEWSGPINTDVEYSENIPSLWTEQPQGAWRSAEAFETSADDAAPDAPRSIQLSAGPTGGSPVVLDLAGLAASGQSLELVIEPNGDGQGVRLRIGAPGPANADTPMTEPDATEMAVTWDPVDAEEEAEEALAVAIDDVNHAAFDDAALIMPVAEPVDEVPVAAESAPADVEATEPLDVDADDTPLADNEAPDDDPAKILADIRARLAALDAAR